jgi:hypothetical protein
VKKYKLTDTKKVVLGVTLFQIQAIADFGNVKSGELGGYIEKESNLSQVPGDAWVHGNAWVSGDAWISGDAQVYGDARVYGDAWVHGNAWVYGNAQVSGNASVYGNAQVSGNASVYGELDIQWARWPLYCVTFTRQDLSVQIGCRRKFIFEWLDLDIDQAQREGLDPKYYEFYKTSIQAVFDMWMDCDD